MRKSGSRVSELDSRLPVMNLNSTFGFSCWQRLPGGAQWGESSGENHTMASQIQYCFVRFSNLTFESCMLEPEQCRKIVNELPGVVTSG